MSDSTRIASIVCLQVRLPFDHGAPPPLFAGKPRTTLDSVWVRVELANGLVGWGESYGGELGAVVSVFRQRVIPLAMGRDILEPGLLAGLDRTLHNMGRSGVVTHALSGLDIAAWDLRGKIEGVPVYELLGGARRERIPAYASLLQYYGNTDDVKRNVDQALRAGYQEIKLHERGVDSVRAAREVMGPELELTLDTNCAWDLPSAVAAIQAMSGYRLKWVEEPIWPPEDLNALRQLRRATGIPMAVGENASSLYELTDLVQAGGVDYLQPSAIKSGGLSTLRTLAGQCAGTAVVHSPQSAFFGPGFLATLQVLAAQAQPTRVERLFCELAHVPYAHSAPFEDGGFVLPQGPGLGADPEAQWLASAHVLAT